MAQPTFRDAQVGPASISFATRAAVQVDFGTSGNAGIVAVATSYGWASNTINSITVGGTMSGGTTTGTVGVAGTTNTDGTISGGTALTLETGSTTTATLGTGLQRTGRGSALSLTGVQWVQVVMSDANGKPSITAATYDNAASIAAGTAFTYVGAALSQSVTTTTNDVAAAVMYLDAADGSTLTVTSPAVQRVRGASAKTSGLQSLVWDSAGLSSSTTIAGTSGSTFGWQGTKWAVTGTAAGPTLSSGSAAATGNTTASGTATTTGTDGTMYAVRSAAQPTNAQIVAGQDSTGAASSAGSLAITSAGAKTIPLTGVAVGSQPLWFLHRPAAGAASDSNVISAALTQPAALAWAGTYPAQSGTAGAAFTHSGTIPTPTGGVGTKTYSATGLGASGLTVNTSTGQLQGTCGTAGTYTITPTVTDSSTAGTPNPQTASLASFTLTISAGGGGGGGTAPSISSHPASQSVTEGATATFSVTASGSGTLTYQWRKNGANISGATASSYTTPATVLADSGALFSVVVTGDTSPPATSNNATLTVNAATGTYTAQTDIIGLAGIAQASTLMYWTWFPSGRPGGMASGVNGSGTTDTAGRLTISHTVAGQGLVIVGTRPGPAVANDRVYAQFLTLA